MKRLLDKWFPVGTRSLLFGAHAVWLHWLFVAWAWTKLYGFPLDPRIWVSFVVHDLGYFSCRAMDDADGKRHPIVGAKIMAFLFGPEWGKFCRYHSRSLARLEGAKPSKLCAADKLAPALTPAWLYIPMATWSGEIYEYMEEGRGVQRGEYIDLLTYGAMRSGDKGSWFWGLKRYMEAWVKGYVTGEEKAI